MLQVFGRVFRSFFAVVLIVCVIAGIAIWELVKWLYQLF